MDIPSISVILQINSTENALAETIRSLQAQSLSDYEVICIIESGNAELAAFLTEITNQDERFKKIIQGNDREKGRSLAVGAAEGQGVLFLNCGNILSPILLQTLYKVITDNCADMAVCSFGTLDSSKRRIPQQAVHTNWLPSGKNTFCYEDCPDYILRVVEPALYSRLFRTGFLRELEITIPAVLEDSDFVIAAVTAAAGRISFVTDDLITGGIPENRSLEEITSDVFCTIERLRCLSHRQIIQNAITSFPVDHFIRAMARGIKDFSLPEVRKFYQTVHETFNSDIYANVSPQTLRNPLRYREFCTVKKHDYEAMCGLISKKLIVSLTTYPRRISTISQVVETLFAQTRKADEIILWLAEEQFPEKEKNLPDALQKLAEEKRLRICWCDDLKAHKKYYYALQEFPDDIVVTVDDDLRYGPKMLATLYQSYLLYPEAVSTMRAHLMLTSPENEILPYHSWIQETDACMHRPSMQLMATGGAGTLYPPGLFRKEFFDKKAIMQHCPLADDLWLKAMQVVSDVPVVVASPHEQLRYVPGTQEQGLYQVNVVKSQNDVQLDNIIQWTDSTFGQGTIIRKLTDASEYEQILGIEAVAGHIDAERTALRRKNASLEVRIQQRETEIEALKQTEKALNKAELQLKQMTESLNRAERREKQTAEQLQQTLLQLAQAEESKPIRNQLRAQGRALFQQKKQNSSAGLLFKRFIYYAAWVPEKMLEVMMYYLQNGAKQTLKQIYRRLFHRGQ